MSSNFIWQDTYNIGNEKIDRQHKYLFDLANQIVDPNNDTQKTYHNVLALYHYVREHFSDEQALMKAYNYADFQAHLEEHDQLVKKLTEISTGIIRGETNPDEIITFMRSWLLDHILGKDMLLKELIH